MAFQYALGASVFLLLSKISSSHGFVGLSVFSVWVSCNVLNSKMNIIFLNIPYVAQIAQRGLSYRVRQLIDFVYPDHSLMKQHMPVGG